MRKLLYIMCAMAFAAGVAACSPKATADGVEPNGDTVEVDPTDMSHPTDSVTANAEK